MGIFMSIDLCFLFQVVARKTAVHICKRDLVQQIIIIRRVGGKANASVAANAIFLIPKDWQLRTEHRVYMANLIEHNTLRYSLVVHDGVVHSSIWRPWLWYICTVKQNAPWVDKWQLEFSSSLLEECLYKFKNDKGGFSISVRNKQPNIYYVKDARQDSMTQWN